MYKIHTYGTLEHSLQGLEKIQVVVVEFEVNLPQIWSSIHAHLHQHPWLRVKGVFPVRSHRRPPNYLCPKKTNISSLAKEFLIDFLDL